MKICIIGSAGHYSYVVEGLRKNQDLKLVGVALGSDVDSPEILIQLADELKSNYYESYVKMLDIEKPDVVGVASRFDLNADISIECLKRGIHCITEKTIAHSHEKLCEIRKAALDNNAKIIGMHGMRYHPDFYAAYKALHSGSIGEPRLITGQKSYGFDCNRPGFYKDRNRYGGTMLWIAPHAIDWTYWMMGEFKSIFALHSAKNNLGYGSCEMAGIIAFSFPNGAMGSINFDFYQPKKSINSDGDQVRIVGDNGIISVRYGKAFLTTNDQPETELSLEKGDFFGDFCRELKGEGECRLSMNDTFEVTKLCLQARESADLNGKVFNI